MITLLEFAELLASPTRRTILRQHTIAGLELALKELSSLAEGLELIVMDLVTGRT